MSINIVGEVDKDRIYCAGSFTKCLTTYASLSFLAEKYNLADVLDDENFLDSLCVNGESKYFLNLFQDIIKSKFSIRDLCSYYSGLPYTFDLSEGELAAVQAGLPFKHHQVPDEETFLYLCKHKITPVYTKKCKFHYSEIGIIVLGYFLEKAFSTSMEVLYKKHLTDKFKLNTSQFSRTRVAGVYTQDLSPAYDYPSIAIVDHGYFCYSNGYYTTLNDMKKLLEQLIGDPIFAYMTDIKKARAASGRLLNGLATEIRLVDDDILYGYEGLSFSGCNIWAYSTKKKMGYITFSNDEEAVYDILYKDQLGYTVFDKVPAWTELLYQQFLKHYLPELPEKEIPIEYQGDYKRVNINQSTLDMVFRVGNNFIVIRDPSEVQYNVTYYQQHYCVKGKDGTHGAKVGFYQAVNGQCYMLYEGTLYKKCLVS
ncbi:MAG: serine hydrolase domain-containing protein [Gammaproteobacteria bacterium]